MSMHGVNLLVDITLCVYNSNLYHEEHIKNTQTQLILLEFTSVSLATKFNATTKKIVHDSDGFCVVYGKKCFVKH